jgi:hypothetical protein
VVPALALLGLAAAPAAADPVAHLAWDDCGAAGLRTRTFACDTNAGAEQLVVSFVPPDAVPAFTGIDVSIRFWPPAASLPPWWALSAGGCRATSLKSSPISAGPSPCTSPWTSGTFSAAQLVSATQEIRALSDLPKGSEHALESGIEYYGMRIVFDHARSAGAGACGGCAMPAGLYLARLTLLLGPDPNFDYPLTELPYVNWQCDGSPVLSYDNGWTVTGWDFPACGTPARERTWGAIQSLYR